jgi:bifunctional non-homologous end joining protein LigD
MVCDRNAQRRSKVKSAEKIVNLAEQMGGIRQSLPADLLPMLAKLGTEADLIRPGAAFELKFDGARALVAVQGGKASIRFRSGQEVATGFPEVVQKVKSLDAVLDGELVAYDERGLPSFERLAPRLQGGAGAPAVFVVFDALSVGGIDVRHLGWGHRRQLLEALAAARSDGALVPSVVFDNGPALYGWACERGLEGVMVKDRAAPYRAGERTAAWLKVKPSEESDFVVIGFTRGEGGRERLGALELATFDGEGTLRTRGRVGSGLSEAAIAAMLPLFDAWATDVCPAVGELDRAPAGRMFVQPRLTVRVRYQSWTSEGRLRFPVFRGISKALPQECTECPV